MLLLLEVNWNGWNYFYVQHIFVLNAILLHASRITWPSYYWTIFSLILDIFHWASYHSARDEFLAENYEDKLCHQLKWNDVCSILSEGDKKCFCLWYKCIFYIYYVKVPFWDEKRSGWNIFFECSTPWKLNYNFFIFYNNFYTVSVPPLGNGII